MRFSTFHLLKKRIISIYLCTCITLQWPKIFISCHHIYRYRQQIWLYSSNSNFGIFLEEMFWTAWSKSLNLFLFYQTCIHTISVITCLNIFPVICANPPILCILLLQRLELYKNLLYSIKMNAIQTTKVCLLT